MADEKVIKDIEELHNSLEKAGLIEEHSEILESFDHDVKDILESPGDFSFDHYPVFADKLQTIAEKFEISHPKISDAIKGIINTLNSIGA